jgi:hypothetical protein
MGLATATRAARKLADRITVRDPVVAAEHVLLPLRGAGSEVADDAAGLGLEEAPLGGITGLAVAALESLEQLLLPRDQCTERRFVRARVLAFEIELHLVQSFFQEQSNSPVRYRVTVFVVGVRKARVNLSSYRGPDKFFERLAATLVGVLGQRRGGPPEIST